MKKKSSSYNDFGKVWNRKVPSQKFYFLKRSASLCYGYFNWILHLSFAHGGKEISSLLNFQKSWQVCQWRRRWWEPKETYHIIALSLCVSTQMKWSKKRKRKGFILRAAEDNWRICKAGRSKKEKEACQACASEWEVCCLCLDISIKHECSLPNERAMERLNEWRKFH
jgi:hypothetical protein